MNTTHSERSRRRFGILLHPTSLPSPEGIGTLGAEATKFLDWLSASGARAWQMLPLVPVGAGHSPYSSSSAFAGNPLLISLSWLADAGWLTAEELSQQYKHAEAWGVDSVAYPEVIKRKSELLKRAAQRYLEAEDRSDELLMLCERHEWLEDTALFDAISNEVQLPWWRWPATLRQRSTRALKHARARFQGEIKRYLVIQMWFETQWSELRSDAEERGIELIGDVPIYVDHNSADVWSHQHLFALDLNGKPRAVAGVPPDAFSETGQLWGNPLYDWDAHESEEYAWWGRRLKRALSLTHVVRVDHFRAFAAYWSVPYGAVDAREGEWITGPGMRLFDALDKHLAPQRKGRETLPLIAEDLGLIDEPVRVLLAQTGLPGMKVLQFAFEGNPDQEYLPHNYTSTRCVVYTGTHDNQTTRGWWESASETERDQARRYCSISGDAEQIGWDLTRLAFSSIAALAVIPLQDLLALGDDARMNQPSVAEGNWSWRVRDVALNSEISSRLLELSARYSR